MISKGPRSNSYPVDENDDEHDDENEDENNDANDDDQ